jgi:hypothetical protein
MAMTEHNYDAGPEGGAAAFDAGGPDEFSDSPGRLGRGGDDDDSDEDYNVETDDFYADDEDDDGEDFPDKPAKGRGGSERVVEIPAPTRRRGAPKINNKRPRPVQFASLASIYDVAEKIGLMDVLEKHVPAPPPGDVRPSLLIMATAMNFAVQQAKKTTTYRWFIRSVLGKLFPVLKADLFSRKVFWHNMRGVGEETAGNIFREAAANAAGHYGLSPGTLAFTKSDFIRFDVSQRKGLVTKNTVSKFDTAEDYGVAVAESRSEKIPLAYALFPLRDDPDYPAVFRDLLSGLPEAGNILVDCRVSRKKIPLNILGTPGLARGDFISFLDIDSRPEFLSLPDEAFSPLPDGAYPGALVGRAGLEIGGQKLAVLAVRDDELLERHAAVQAEHLKLALAMLERLKNKPGSWNPRSFDSPGGGARGEVSVRLADFDPAALRGPTRGDNWPARPQTAALEKLAAASRQPSLEGALDITIVVAENGAMSLDYRVDEARLAEIRRTRFGKFCVCTNRPDLSDLEIYSAYRAPVEAERGFGALRKIRHLPFRPSEAFSTFHMRVHSLCYMLSYLLCSLVSLEFKRLGRDLDIGESMRVLGAADFLLPEEIAHYSERGGYRRAGREELALAREYMESLNVYRYLDLYPQREAHVPGSSPPGDARHGGPDR